MTSPIQKPSLGATRRCGVAVLALCVGMGAADAALAGRQKDASKVPQTSAEANTDNLGSAVVAPLRDINVVRSEIPDLLKKAVVDPYAPPRMGCAPLKAEIADLDAVLGDDYDDPKDDDKDESLSRPVLGVVANTITDVIPMRGWVRRLTGAERHDQQVREAIKAGFVRRGYLKGLQNAGACGGDRLVFVSAKPAPKPPLVAAEAVPVQVAASPPSPPIRVDAPLAPFASTIRVATAADSAGGP